MLRQLRLRSDKVRVEGRVRRTVDSSRDAKINDQAATSFGSDFLNINTLHATEMDLQEHQG